MTNKKRVFSCDEKEDIRNSLITECEKAWKEKGYKKSSISYLTSNVNISTGAFYNFFETKEDLFFETLINVQHQLKEELEKILSVEPNKAGLVKYLKWLYREYNQRQYLYDFSNPDFQSFISKISEDKFEELKEYNLDFSESIIIKANLKYKVSKELAFDTLQALLFTVSMQESIIVNKEETFNFILDNIIDELFE